MQVSLKYGMNSVTLDKPEGTTIGHLLGDANTKALLGFGDNVVPTVEGSVVEHGFALSDEDEVVLQPKAATKGS